MLTVINSCVFRQPTVVTNLPRGGQGAMSLHCLHVQLLVVLVIVIIQSFTQSAASCSRAISEVLMNPPRRQTGVMRFLTDWWSQQHQVVLHDESPKLPPLRGNFQTQLCCVLNFCVCSGRGQVALFFHKSLASLLRPNFVRRQKVTPPGRSALDDALLVLRFRSSYSSSDAASYLPSLEEDVEPKPCPADVWYHLSYMNLTTFHCTLLPLHLATEGQCGPGYNLVLPPDAAFQSSVEQFSADIDFDFRWQVHFFTVSRSEQLGQLLFLGQKVSKESKAWCRVKAVRGQCVISVINVSSGTSCPSFRSEPDPGAPFYQRIWLQRMCT